MASLWNKITLSSKTNVHPINEETQKRRRKQSLSARSRKSLAQIFPNLYIGPSDDKENAPAAELDLKCEEAGNYPIYDAENPSHNTAYQPPIRQSRSWSPLKEQIQKGKASLRSKSPSPTRMLTSSRKALNELANSFKATAAAIRPSTPTLLLRDVSPVGQDSEKSIKSKKSGAHWRSSESTKTGEDVSKGSSPVLPDCDYSDHFLGSKTFLTDIEINVSPPDDPFADPSDESMSNVDETDDSSGTRQESLNVEKGRIRTPSPAGMPLPESPMPGGI